MLTIEINIDGSWEWGFKRYTLMYGKCRVCLLDTGPIQIKIMRRKS